jgi:hypothetical protein
METQKACGRRCPNCPKVVRRSPQVPKCRMPGFATQPAAAERAPQRLSIWPRRGPCRPAQPMRLLTVRSCRALPAQPHKSHSNGFIVMDANKLTNWQGDRFRGCCASFNSSKWSKRRWICNKRQLIMCDEGSDRGRCDKVAAIRAR